MVIVEIFSNIMTESAHTAKNLVEPGPRYTKRHQVHYTQTAENKNQREYLESSQRNAIQFILGKQSQEQMLTSYQKTPMP